MSYVRVAEKEHEEPMEVPCEDDGTISLSTLLSLFPGSCGLMFRNRITNAMRGVRLTDFKLQAPNTGWGDTIYICVFPKINMPNPYTCNTNEAAAPLHHPAASTASGPGCIPLQTSKEHTNQVMQSVQQAVAHQQLDFSYVTSRVAVMPHPAEGLKSAYRNHIEEVRSFLDSQHPGHYRIYNISGRGYTSGNFSGKVCESGWPPKKAPPLLTLVNMCHNMFLYLQQDPNNICVVQCLDGKSSSAVLVCAFLIFCKVLKKPKEALQLFELRRCCINILASQIRYLEYVGKIVDQPPLHPHDSPVTFTSITVKPVPLFTKLRAECRPFVELYMEEELVLNTCREYEEMRVFKLDDNQITISLNATVVGDVCLIFYHAGSTYGIKGQMLSYEMFRLQLHTGFIPIGSESLNFNRHQLDNVRVFHRYPDLSVSLHLTVSETGGTSHQASLWQEISQLYLNHRVLFSSDEEMVACISHFGHPDRPLLNTADDTVPKAVTTSLSWQDADSSQATFLACDESRSDSVNITTTPSTVDVLYKYHASPAEANLDLSNSSTSIGTTLPLTNLLDLDNNIESSTNNLDFLGNLQTLPLITQTNSAGYNRGYDPFNEESTSSTNQARVPFAAKLTGSDLFSNTQLEQFQTNCSANSTPLHKSSMRSSAPAYNASANNKSSCLGSWDSVYKGSSIANAGYAFGGTDFEVQAFSSQCLKPARIPHEISTSNLGALAKSDPFADPDLLCLDDDDGHNRPIDIPPHPIIPVQKANILWKPIPEEIGKPEKNEWLEDHLFFIQGERKQRPSSERSCTSEPTQYFLEELEEDEALIRATKSAHLTKEPTEVVKEEKGWFVKKLDVFRDYFAQIHLFKKK